MCGITGFYSLEKTIDLKKFYKSHKLLNHRGPDDEGFVLEVDHFQNLVHAKCNKTISYFSSLPDLSDYNKSHLIMGHHRLSILDLSPAGHQPMASTDGRYWIVFNGEIFNYIELREELRKEGWNIKSTCDTEVLLKAFIQWGNDCFNKLNGMWALAIFDNVEMRITLSRDRYGIKPLYYAVIDKALYFASEAKFILSFLDSLKPNHPVIADYVVNCYLDHCEETMFKDIFQVMPGTFKTFDGENLEGRVYWTFQPAEDSLKNYDQACEEMESLFNSSVDLRLRSDVPVGSLLSGGLDSNAIVCNVHNRHRDTIKDFHLFSAVYEEERFSEKKYIEHTLAKTGFQQHWIYPDPKRISEEINDIIFFMDFPVRSLQIYSQWTIMKNVRSLSPVIVLLNGQGSDEIFGGYTLDYFSFFGELFQRRKWGRLIDEIKILRNMRSISLYRIITSIIFHIHTQSKSARKHFLKAKCPVLNLDAGYNYIPYPYMDGSLFMTHLFNSLKFSALPEYLRYEDRNSMAYGLETRLPFMDYRIIEWAFTLPAVFKIFKGKNKRVLREYAAKFVPEIIINREDKQGFVTPQQEWQRSILQEPMEDLLSEDMQAFFPFLTNSVVTDYFNNYKSGKHDNWALIWRLYCLQLWRQKWF